MPLSIFHTALHGVVGWVGTALLLYESSRFDQENCHSLCKWSKACSPLKSTILNIPLKITFHLFVLIF